MTDLKTLTREIHAAAENNPMSQMLVSGDMTIEEWATFLRNQLEAYQALEGRKLIQLADVLRVPRITADIESTGVDISKIKVVPATWRYAEYVRSLPDHLVWSHIYVRYMGDAHGGQMIKKASRFSTNLLDFTDRVAVIKYLREHTADADPDEAIIAFKWVMDIYSEMHKSLRP